MAKTDPTQENVYALLAEIKSLKANIRRKQTILRAVEWTADGEELRCPYCYRTDDEGHHPECALEPELKLEGT